ncbi:helix-turn-helix domain-containing protein [Enterobacter hormaechei]|nr:helix-turn-helix domain-containing protein [Enterobacter hormaechei]
MTVFIQRLRQTMQEHGLSQVALAKLIGVTSQTVNGWRLGRTFPRWKVLERLSAVTERPLYWFFMTEAEESRLLADTPAPSNRQDSNLTLMELLPKLSDDALRQLTRMAKEMAREK